MTGVSRRGTRKLFGVARELAREDPEQLVEDGFGQEQPVVRFDDAKQGRLGSAAREDQGRHRDVGVDERRGKNNPVDMRKAVAGRR